MKISDKQQAILDSLIVERLTERPENLALTSTFKNAKNPTLEKIISTNHASLKDTEGSVAYYIVKTKDNVLLLYFSLKCGELFQTLDVQKMEIAAVTLTHLHIVSNPENFSKEDVEQANAFINNHLGEINSILPNIQYYARKNAEYVKDIDAEPNTDVRRVLNTYPAIEIVEFCANDNARSKWKEYNLPKKMGECIFWHYMVPILLSIQKL